MAIEENLLTASSIVEDSPINVSTPAGLYVLRTMIMSSKGMSVLEPHFSVTNIPAVRTLILFGPRFLCKQTEAIRD